jgi:uncharacterized RDD family membrane protein YckC
LLTGTAVAAVEIFFPPNVGFLDPRPAENKSAAGRENLDRAALRAYRAASSQRGRKQRGDFIMDYRETEWVDVGFWKKWGLLLLLVGLLCAALCLPIGLQETHQRSRAYVAQLFQRYDVSRAERAALHHPHLPPRSPWLGVGLAGLLAAVVGTCVLRAANKREQEYANRSQERDRRAFIAALPEFRYAITWRRLAAVLIDGCVLGPVITATDLLRDASSQPVGLLGLVLYIVLPMVYVIILLGMRGQTVGKWLLRVKVLALTEGPLSLRQSCLRYSVPMGFGLAYFGVLATLKLGTFETRHWLMLTVVILAIDMVWLLADGITLLATPKRRSIHDFIGQSVVVRCAD